MMVFVYGVLKRSMLSMAAKCFYRGRDFIGDGTPMPGI